MVIWLLYESSQAGMLHKGKKQVPLLFYSLHKQILLLLVCLLAWCLLPVSCTRNTSNERQQGAVRTTCPNKLNEEVMPQYRGPP